jgi:hypothetical protein
MQSQFYVIMDDNPQDHREFDDVECMQDFVINNAKVEGDLFLKGMSGMKITYNTQTGNVSIENIEKMKWITHFFSADAFQANILPIEEAIRRLAKLELLAKLFIKFDSGICEIIQKNHTIDKGTGKILSHTSESHLDMTLTQILRFVNPGHKGVLLLNSIFSGESKKHQTQLQISIYFAFKECQLYAKNGLDTIKSKNDAEKIKQCIEKHQNNSDRLPLHRKTL